MALVNNVWTWPTSQLVVVVPDDETNSIDSFYFVLDLSIQNNIVPVTYVLTVLRNIGSLIVHCGLEEMTAGIDGDPHLSGHIELNFAPKLSFPRGYKPTLMIVTYQEGIALEMLSIGDPLPLSTLDPILEILDAARKASPPGRPFRDIDTSTDNPASAFKFELQTKTRIPVPGLTNKLVTSITDTIMSALVEIDPCELSFNVLQVLQGKKYTIGTGNLARTVAGSIRTPSRNSSSIIETY